MVLTTLTLSTLARILNGIIVVLIYGLFARTLSVLGASCRRSRTPLAPSLHNSDTMNSYATPLSDNPWPPPALYTLVICTGAIDDILSIDFFNLNTVKYWQNHLANAYWNRKYKRQLTKASGPRIRPYKLH
jgi:hypothetical protein